MEDRAERKEYKENLDSFHPCKKYKNVSDEYIFYDIEAYIWKTEKKINNKIVKKLEHTAYLVIAKTFSLNKVLIRQQFRLKLK